MDNYKAKHTQDEIIDAANAFYRQEFKTEANIVTDANPLPVVLPQMLAIAMAHGYSPKNSNVAKMIDGAWQIEINGFIVSFILS